MGTAEAVSKVASGAATSKKTMPSLLDVVALGIWMGGIHIATILIFSGLFNLPSPWAFALLAILATLSVIPLYDDSAFARALGGFICRRALKYFPVTVIVEDQQALSAAAPCVLGVEPHSILPLGTIGLNQYAATAPLPKLKLGATNAIFNVPLLRHIWTWMGCAPAGKKDLKALLAKGVTIGVVPGGVQECFYLEKGVETIYIKKRKGFVRLAMEERRPLVPVFIFGQSDVYNWWKPSGKWYKSLSRSIGFAPLLFWGVWGSFIPLPKPMTVVVGKPIMTPAPDATGSFTTDQVDAVHQTFVSEMERLFRDYKTQAGCASVTLRIL